jgi:PAS domain S-box-containing protein
MYILVFSVVLQFVAAFLALRLIRLTGRITAWTLIAAAVFFMALRRLITLSHLISGDMTYHADFTAEIVAMLSSIVMLSGIALIRPLFLSMKRKEEALRESEEKFRGLVNSMERDIAMRKQAEEAVQKERDRAQRYLDLAGVIMVAMGTDRRVNLINRKGCELLGYPESEIIGKNWMENFIPETIRGDVEGVFARLMEGEAVLVEYHENPVLTRSGEERLIAWHNVVLTDEGGRFAGTLSSGEDITERKKAEEALRESEERYSSLFENNHAVMLLVDPDDAGIVDANPAACSYYGYDRAALTSMKMTEINTLSREELFKEIEKARTKSRNHFVFKHRLANGYVRDVEVYSGPINVYGKNLLYSIIHDITERKRAEEALRDSESKFKAVFLDAHIGIAIIGLDGRIIESNPALHNMLGLSREELRGISFTDFIHPDERETDISLFKTLIEGRKDQYQKETRFINKDNRVIRIRLAVSLVRDVDKRPLYAIGIAEDITERRLAEEALRESESKFKDLAEKSLAGIYLIQDGIFKYVNPRLAEVFGYEAEELIDKRGPEYLTLPDDLPVVSENIRKRINGTLKSVHYEFRGVTKDGKILNLEVYGTRTTYQGQPAVVGTLMEIKKL